MDPGPTGEGKKDQEVKFVTHSHKDKQLLALFLVGSIGMISECHPLTLECKLIQTQVSSRKWRDNEGPEVIWN